MGEKRKPTTSPSLRLRISKGVDYGKKLYWELKRRCKGENSKER